MVTVSAGFTAEEICEFVLEYQVQPHGQKGPWLAAQGVSRGRLARWRAAVLAGDVERGLVPREGGGMRIPPGQPSALERVRARERAEHEAEVERLNARVAELEETNQALGKLSGSCTS